jgi:hypothetical protein
MQPAPAGLSPELESTDLTQNQKMDALNSHCTLPENSMQAVRLGAFPANLIV